MQESVRCFTPTHIIDYLLSMAAEPRVSKRARSVPTRFVAEAPAAKKPRAAATAPSKAKKQAKAAPTKAAGAKGATKPSQKKTPATKAKAKSTRAAEPAKAKKVRRGPWSRVDREGRPKARVRAKVRPRCHLGTPSPSAPPPSRHARTLCTAAGEEQACA